MITTAIKRKLSFYEYKCNAAICKKQKTTMYFFKCNTIAIPTFRKSPFDWNK